jgi:hypothetical protein
VLTDALCSKTSFGQVICTSIGQRVTMPVPSGRKRILERIFAETTALSSVDLPSACRARHDAELSGSAQPRCRVGVNHLPAEHADLWPLDGDTCVGHVELLQRFS